VPRGRPDNQSLNRTLSQPGFVEHRHSEQAQGGEGSASVPICLSSSTSWPDPIVSLFFVPSPTDRATVCMFESYVAARFCDGNGTLRDKLGVAGPLVDRNVGRVRILSSSPARRRPSMPKP